MAPGERPASPEGLYGTDILHHDGRCEETEGDGEVNRENGGEGEDDQSAAKQCNRALGQSKGWAQANHDNQKQDQREEDEAEHDQFDEDVRPEDTRELLEASAEGNFDRDPRAAETTNGEFG